MTTREKARKKRPKAAKYVVLKGLPPGFIDDLPEEEQRAISAVVGKPIRLNKYGREGRAELEFIDYRENAIHLLYVDPKFIKPW